MTVMKISASTLAIAFAVFSFSVAWAVRLQPGPRDGVETVPVMITALSTPETVGDLKVLAAWQLSAADRRFGGWSDLRLRDDGTALAISDQGYWLAFAPPTQAGEVTAQFGVIRNELAAPLGSKQEADAEGLAVLPDGRALVSFEARHRIDAYDLSARAFLAAASPGPPLQNLSRLGGNQGLEALALLPDGRIFAGAESGEIWLTRADAKDAAPISQRLALPLGWMLTTASGADKTLYLVWRFFNPLTRELQVDIRACPMEGLDRPPLQCRRLALLSAPFPVDNIEAIEAQTTPEGVRLTLMSDDNFSRDQRTLFLQFLLPSED